MDRGRIVIKLDNLIKNKTKVIYLSISAALITLSLKFTAYYLTKSVGLLGDTAESLVNLAAAIMATVILAYSSRPADTTHTYGHDKAEYFSSGVEGALILIAAAGIGISATKRLFQPVPLENLGTGLVIALIASGVNYIVAKILLQASQQHDSITLEADAKHLLTDVWTSLGVVAGLGVVAVTGLTLLDPIIAYAVAANIIFSGSDLVKRSFRGLMDYSLPSEEIQAIENILKNHSAEVSHYHNVRTRKSGPTRFIDFHILMAGETTVQAAHDLCEVIEKEIETELANSQVTIHVEPVEDKSSWDVIKAIKNKN
jgi:cation diffusion facilitator family transporter